MPKTAPVDDIDYANCTADQINHLRYVKGLPRVYAPGTREDGIAERIKKECHGSWMLCTPVRLLMRTDAEITDILDAWRRTPEGTPIEQVAFQPTA